MSPSEIPTYSAEEIRRRLAEELPAWRYERGWLRRDVPVGPRPAALLVAGRIAHLAEAAFHHPDLELRGDVLEVRVRHHWAAGITDGDFALARAVERILRERPGAAGS